MLTRDDIEKIQTRIRAGMSKSEACETQARRRAYLRWEKDTAHLQATKNFPAPDPKKSREILVEAQNLTTQEYCAAIQKKLLAGLLSALDTGEPWAYKEASNVLSKLMPEWKEKKAKKQVPLEAYQAMLEKAMKKNEQV